MWSAVLLGALLAGGCAGLGLPPALISHAVTDALLVKMLECEATSAAGAAVLKQLPAFWQPDFQLEKMDRNLGCLATCALLKLKWIDANEKLNEQNLKNFLLFQKADLNTLMKQIDAIRRCYVPEPNNKISCTPGFEFLKCYRTAIFELGWNPLKLFSSFA